MQEIAPKLSVRIVTFNHVEFIEQAIESALTQETSFPFEIIIGEDCSTDGTRELVQKYQDKYPNIIHALMYQENMGRQYNFLNTLKACRGKYIAMLDGDDFWTSTNKLQKQVDFLELNQDFVLCFTSNQNQFNNNDRKPHVRGYEKREFTFDDMLLGNKIEPSAAVFRNGLVKDYPTCFNDVPFCDWPFYTMLAEHGKMRFIDDVFGVRRIHSTGVWSSQSTGQKLQGRVAFYQAMMLYVSNVDLPVIKQQLAITKKNLKHYRYRRNLRKNFPTGYEMYRKVRGIFDRMMNL